MSDAAAVEVSAIVPAPPVEVFRAWTEPDVFVRWWSPGPMTATEAELDVRVGGRYRIGMRPPGGDVDYVGGSYLEVDEPHRLVFTWAWESGEFAGTGESLVTVEFGATDGGTEVAIRHARLESDQSRAAHRQGWEDIVAALARELAR